MNFCIVFDIGGTWFRSALLNYASNSITEIEKSETPNYLKFPDLHIEELQNLLLDEIILRTRQYQSRHGDLELNTVSLSLGAAINEKKNLVLNSGPIWGPNCVPLNMVSKLRERQPSISWFVSNDITALIHACSHSFGGLDATRKIALFTVSSGVGCRIINRSNNHIPVDPDTGLQGEIGHLPIKFYLDGVQLQSVCDCGGSNHLNAFCSGRGIEKLLARFPEHYLDESLLGLRHKLEKSDPHAEGLIREITRSIADLIVAMLVFDPEIDKIIFVGGCIHALSPFYFNALLQHLEEIELYQTSARRQNYFREKLIVSDAVGNYGLIGAGLIAKNRVLQYA